MNNTVRDLRMKLGLSQAQLASRLGVSRQTINSIEVGRYTPSLALAFAIAELFRTRIEKIFFPGGKS